MDNTTQMKDITRIIGIIGSLIGAHIKQMVLKFRLWLDKKQRNNSVYKANKYQASSTRSVARLPYGNDEVEDYWE